jgi:hypothetical protein
MASRNIGRLFTKGTRYNPDVRISQTPVFHCKLVEITEVDFPVLLNYTGYTPNQSV